MALALTLFQISDPAFQTLVWSSDARAFWFDEHVICCLFDDLGFHGGAVSRIGRILVDESEAEAMNKLLVLLDRVSERGGPAGLPESALPLSFDRTQLPEGLWRDVMAAAEEALGAIARNGLPPLGT